MRGAAIVVAGLLALAACHLHATPRDEPAVVTNPTAQSRAELQRVVSRALHRPAVILADDALGKESTLVVERTVRRDAQGRPLQGRVTERPESFRLVKNGPRCVLVHERTGRRWTLRSTSCVAR